jgi:hypothetical protein
LLLGCTFKRCFVLLYVCLSFMCGRSFICGRLQAA